MLKPMDSAYFTDRAAQARRMAARAMSRAARNIHLALAADYDERSGRGVTGSTLRASVFQQVEV